MNRSGRGAFSVLKDEDQGFERDTSPLIYQPSALQEPPSTAQGPVTVSSANTNVVELQPMSGGQPVTVQVVPKPQANDHLYLTIALMVMFMLLCCNFMGALCLVPGLICAAVGADYNKAGNTEKARSMGAMAFVYDMVVVTIHIVLQVIGFLITVIAVGVVFSQTSNAIDQAAHAISIPTEFPTFPSA